MSKREATTLLRELSAAIGRYLAEHRQPPFSSTAIRDQQRADRALAMAMDECIDFLRREESTK